MSADTRMATREETRLRSPPTGTSCSCLVTLLPPWLGHGEDTTDKRLSTVDSHPEAQRHPFEDGGGYFFDLA